MTALKACPRILLLTWQRPDGRYAGAEAMRKIVSALPPDRFRWAYLDRRMEPAPAGLPPSEGFAPRRAHWRMRNTALRYWFEQHWQAPRLVERIARWAEPFRPEVLWVLAEMGAATMAPRLARRLGAPLHATVHDAFEFGRLSLPRRYYALYRRSARRLLEDCASLDAISPELLERLAAFCPSARAKPSLVFPSSIRTADVQPGVPAADGAVRRIALCGSMRIDAWQWDEFLAALTALPWRFELLAFVEPRDFFRSALPGNVRLRFGPYAPTEAELVRQLAGAGVWACYLGVSRAPGDADFARYSFSSKLTAYAAAALPSIVDAPADSAVWRRVREFGAGLHFDGGEPARQGLQELFGSAGARQRMGEGALRLCRGELNLDRNAAAFVDVLARAAVVHSPGKP